MLHLTILSIAWLLQGRTPLMLFQRSLGVCSKPASTTVPVLHSAVLLSGSSSSSAHRSVKTAAAGPGSNGVDSGGVPVSPDAAANLKAFLAAAPQLLGNNPSVVGYCVYRVQSCMV
jgi:hypothetical protein